MLQELEDEATRKEDAAEAALASLTGKLEAAAARELAATTQHEVVVAKLTNNLVAALRGALPSRSSSVATWFKALIF